ncbi:hypothetical protein KI387_017411, partial [Taxus chinensis]
MGENLGPQTRNDFSNDIGSENKHRCDALDSTSPAAKKSKTDTDQTVKNELGVKDVIFLNDRTKDADEDAENKNDQGSNNLAVSEWNLTEADGKTHGGHTLIIDSDNGNRQWPENDKLEADVHSSNNKNGVTEVAQKITLIEADAAEDKGSRHTMEDAWVVLLDASLGIPGKLRSAHFAIYDGHGGRQAADYARAHLHSDVLSAGLPRELMDIKAAKKAIIDGFRKTDDALLKESVAGGWQDGATAVCVWILGQT